MEQENRHRVADGKFGSGSAPAAHGLGVGDVVTLRHGGGPAMTVNLAIAADADGGPRFECVWFGSDDATLYRGEFSAAALVLA